MHNPKCTSDQMVSIDHQHPSIIGVQTRRRVPVAQAFANVDLGTGALVSA